MITLNIIGLNETIAKLNELPKQIEQELSATLKNGAKNFVRNAQRDAPFDIGFLKDQITYKDVGPITFEVVSGSKYAAYLEFGTKGRIKIPQEYVEFAGQFRSDGTEKNGKGFYDNILDWVKRKGFAALKTKSGKRSKSLESTIAEEQAAFAIYLSIIRHGIKPQPYFFKQAPLIEKQLNESVPLVLEKIKL